MSKTNSIYKIYYYYIYMFFPRHLIQNTSTMGHVNMIPPLFFLKLLNRETCTQPLGHRRFILLLLLFIQQNTMGHVNMIPPLFLKLLKHELRYS
jgi:hypothetical protein